MGFRKIFWGFIFMFDFRINGFDILPDIIGYILIFSGLCILYELNDRFESAKNLAIALIIFSIFDIFQFNTQLNDFSFSPYTFLMLIIGIISIILNILLVYNLCMGIAEKADELTKYELKRSAKSRWTIYLVFQITLLSSLIFVFILPLIFIPIFIFSIITYVMLLTLFSSAEKELENIN